MPMPQTSIAAYIRPNPTEDLELAEKPESDKSSSGGDVFSDSQDKTETSEELQIKKHQAQDDFADDNAPDANLVQWDGSEDPTKPQNWPRSQQWRATLLVSLYALLPSMVSSMVAPALPAIAADFNINGEVELSLTFSIFILGFAAGPLLFAPLSEVYGRWPVLQVGNAWFLLWNLGCGLSQSSGQIAAFRFLSGFGGGASMVIGGGTISDCWKPENRGRAISLFTLVPLLGPAAGPIVGAFVAENTTWRWAFWSTSIASALVQVCGLFFLPETYPPILLNQKKARLVKETGNVNLYTEHDNQHGSLSRHLLGALKRPCVLIATQPIVQVMALYMAYVYGLTYLVLATFPDLFTTREYYNERLSIGSLNYISIGLGLFLGVQIGGPLNDRFYRRLKSSKGGARNPEYRVPMMIPGSILVPVGLFIYGWTAETKQHWVLPDLGAAIFSAGIVLILQCCQAYIIDAYMTIAASALAACAVLRSIFGFCFPLFAPAMYDSLGYGWGNSVLAFVAIALGLPCPFLLWTFGSALRSRSKYAVHS